MQKSVKNLHGAYGTVLMDKNDASRLVVARSGSPLVIGLGIGENFIASDQLALLPVTRRFIFLEEGDVVDVTLAGVQVYSTNGEKISRAVHQSDVSLASMELGPYSHFMQKEILILQNPISFLFMEQDFGMRFGVMSLYRLI